jgi:NAD(P)-dependent dehydrogenase (short-subunit alcohol dehydrogenase family)
MKNKKTAFITGANRGLGLGFVQVLLERDYTVFGGTREISDSLLVHPNLHWLECDVIKNPSIRCAFATIQEQVGSLSLLINNAGIKSESVKKSGTLLDLNRDHLMHILDVNLVSPAMVIKIMSPLLTEDPSYIIQVSSARASHFKTPEKTEVDIGYDTSKAALLMLTACCVSELPGVRIMSVNPGSVKTDMNPDGENSPRDRAEEIILLTENWQLEYQGGFVKHDGGLHPL